MNARGLAVVALALVALVWAWPDGERRGSERAPVDEEAPSAGELRAAELDELPLAREPERATQAAKPVPAEARAAGEDPVRAAGQGPPLGCVLHGRVLASGGTLGAWPPYVAMTDAAGSRRQTKVAENGHYSLAALAPGTWTLSWSALGFRGGEVELVLAEDAPIVRRDLVLVAAPKVEVRVVTPSGESLLAVRGARMKEKRPVPLLPTAVATLEAPGATMAAAEEGERAGEGTFYDSGPLWEACGPDCLGVLVLAIDPPLFVSLVLGTRVIATQAVAPGAKVVSFVVDPETLLDQEARVMLRVVAADTGEPLRGSLVIDSREMHGVRDGSWSHALPPGRYELCFWAAGYARLALALTLAPGETRDLGELRLPREVTIEGRLLDAEGNPVAGRLELGERDARGVLRFRGDSYSFPETDARGRYKVWGLDRGRYVLRTASDDQISFPGRDEPSDEWVSGNVEVSTLGGSVTGFDLHLVKAGTLVLKGATTLPPHSRCKILDPRGELLRYDAFYPGFVPRFALPPGPCTFVLCDGEWRELERHALVIGPGLNELDLAR